MTRGSEAIVVDFAPHAIRDAGSVGDRWFVGLVQYPLLLVLDEQGKVVDRVAGPTSIPSSTGRSRSD